MDKEPQKAGDKLILVFNVLDNRDGLGDIGNLIDFSKYVIDFIKSKNININQIDPFFVIFSGNPEDSVKQCINSYPVKLWTQNVYSFTRTPDWIAHQSLIDLLEKSPKLKEAYRNAHGIYNIATPFPFLYYNNISLGVMPVVVTEHFASSFHACESMLFSEKSYITGVGNYSDLWRKFEIGYLRLTNENSVKNENYFVISLKKDQDKIIALKNEIIEYPIILHLTDDELQKLNFPKEGENDIRITRDVDAVLLKSIAIKCGYQFDKPCAGLMVSDKISSDPVQTLLSIEDRDYFLSLGLTKEKFANKAELIKFLDTTLIIPLYLGKYQGKLLTTIITCIINSDLVAKYKKIVFHLNKAIYIDDSVNSIKSKNNPLMDIQCIQHHFKDPDDLVKLAQLYPGQPMGASGDKTYELGISTGRIPLYFAPDWKTEFLEELQKFCGQYVEEYKNLLSAINGQYPAPPIDAEKFAQYLNLELANNWMTKLRPVFLKNSFYHIIENKIVPECLENFRLRQLQQSAPYSTDFHGRFFPYKSVKGDDSVNTSKNNNPDSDSEKSVFDKCVIS